MKKYVLVGLALATLIAQLFLQLHLAKLDGQTTDEGVHLAAGYTYATTGQWRFDPEHPPLMKLLAGAAILHLHPNITPEMNILWNQSSNYFFDSWRQSRDYGEMLLYQAGNNPEQLLFWGRLPFVIVTFLLGLTILLITWREWGELAALGAVAIYVFDPTVNAHGHLINTDIPASLGYLLVVYTVWKFFQKPTWPWTVAFGASLGLALLLKHTAIIAFPAIIVLFAVNWVLSKRRYYWKTVLPKVLVAIIVTWVVIWAGFGFHDRVAPKTVSATSEYFTTAAHNGSDATIGTPIPGRADRTYSTIRPILDILPGDYVKGVFMVLVHSGNGQGAFFLGQTSSSGWWYYFPVMMVLKTPIPSLLLITFSLILLFRKRPIDWLPVGLVTGAGVFLLCALTSKDDLGVRYMLPLYPILFVAVGYAVATFQKWRYLYLALFAWLALIMIVSYPYYLSYYNDFVGGPYNGYKISADSNVDWGQNLKLIANYIQTNNLKNIYIEYGWDGNSSLDYYLGKNNYRQLSSWVPGDGGYAIIGASAFDSTPQYKFLQTCPGLKQITPGVFICQLH